MGIHTRARGTTSTGTRIDPTKAITRVRRILDSKGSRAGIDYRATGRERFLRELREDHVPDAEITTFLAELDREFDSLLLDDLLAEMKARHVSR